MTEQPLVPEEIEFDFDVRYGENVIFPAHHLPEGRYRAVCKIELLSAGTGVPIDATADPPAACKETRPIIDLVTARWRDAGALSPEAAAVIAKARGEVLG